MSASPLKTADAVLFILDINFNKRCMVKKDPTLGRVFFSIFKSKLGSNLRSRNAKALKFLSSKRNDSSLSRFFYVAGAGVEPTSRDYEPREIPFLHPASSRNNPY